MTADEGRMVGIALGVTLALIAGIALAWLAGRRREDLGRVSDRWLWERREARRRAELDAECGPSRPDRARRS
jgi:hypothetical protein